MVRSGFPFAANPLVLLTNCAAIAAAAAAQLPAQAVFVNPKLFNLLGTHGTPFRNSSFSEFFNPTSSHPPFFQVFDESFLNILGPDANIYQISSNNTLGYAHEAPIYHVATDEVFFASNAGGSNSSDLNHNNQVAKINMKEVEAKLVNLPPGTAINVTVTKLNLPDTIQMTNGGTGPYFSNLILVNSGRGTRPATITKVNPLPPYNATVLLDNFYGRQFNSINDIKIHSSGNFFFTDPDYGFLQGFRPAPILPNQVYRFNPETGVIRVAAVDLIKPNGIAFSPGGNTAYITDTGAATALKSGNDQTRPATIYAFDVDPHSYVLSNRRIFAYANTGIPDGIQVDSDGNVYSGCGDGVQVWNKQGALLGKVFTGTSTPQVAFAGDGRLVILSEFRIFVAHIAAKAINLAYPPGH